MSTKISSYRLEYLDWVRGIGAVIMLQGHVFHSFLRPELKTTGAYTLSQFVGGMPPALFLFLTGVTLAFLMDSRERQGATIGRQIAGAGHQGGDAHRHGRNHRAGGDGGDAQAG